MQKFVVFLFYLTICLTPVTTTITKNNKVPQGRQKVTTTGEIQKTVNAQKKVIICHKGKTITIAEAEVSIHLEHADTLGACPESTPTSSKTLEGSEEHVAEDEEVEEEEEEEGE